MWIMSASLYFFSFVISKPKSPDVKVDLGFGKNMELKSSKLIKNLEKESIKLKKMFWQI